MGAVGGDPVDVVQRSRRHLDQLFAVVRYRLRELLPLRDLPEGMQDGGPHGRT